MEAGKRADDVIPPQIIGMSVGCCMRPSEAGRQSPLVARLFCGSKPMNRIDELREIAELRAEVEQLKLLLSLCEARAHIARMRFIELARLIKEKHLARSPR